MKFEFENSNGEKLSGRLELPESKPKAYAIFAHCFTCTSQISATTVISKKLKSFGIATLRFDFTGLGNSDGDFANTNFSSNVDDIIAAYEALEKEFESPSILIGHSLGGAAVLKAATKLDEVKSVVTIGAPSCTRHVSHLFENAIPEINERGEATVDLAGRKFNIKKQLLDDLKESEILEGLSKLKKSFLIMHSPLDKTVSVDHAAKIFQAVKHPKSFISLDDADHLISKRSDAEYIATLISSWLIKSERNLHTDLKKKPKVGENEIVVQADMNKKFTQDVYTKSHHVIVDEPLSYKGDNLGLTPYQHLLAGLGACTSMTIKMYAERKKIRLESISVKLSHQKIHALDCESCEETEGKVDQIIKEISFKGDFTDEQKERMFEIAERCPVNRTLKSTIEILSKYV